MGRQWLQAKREVANLKKGQAVGKLAKEIAVAAKLGGADPDSNARLAAAVEKARRASVTRDAIERAIKKGAGTGDAKIDIEEAAIEAGANEVLPLTHAENDDIPADRTGARFISDCSATAPVSKWLSSHGWTVVTSEFGYIAK